MIDVHYTPDELSKIIVDCVVRAPAVTSVADFAAGEGSLLRAASDRWPLARIFANDISTKAANRMRKLYPTWSVTRSDFLSARLGSLSDRLYDVILLNPPFSRRGRPPVSWKPWGSACSSGVGLAFVSRALELLTAGGTLVAVLPDGAFVNEADRLGWAQIDRRFDVERILKNCSSTFDHARAHTSVVRITKTKRPKASADGQTSSVSKPVQELPLNLKLIRGQRQMHKAKFVPPSRGLPLVHTTDLHSGTVDVLGLRHIADGQIVKGPALLLPRVGQPSASKVCILAAGGQVVLSDCVIAITCDSIKHSKLLRNLLLGRWDSLENAYRGTGARFITLQRLHDVLTDLPAEDLDVFG